MKEPLKQTKVYQFPPIQPPVLLESPPIITTLEFPPEDDELLEDELLEEELLEDELLEELPDDGSLEDESPEEVSDEESSG